MIKYNYISLFFCYLISSINAQEIPLEISCDTINISTVEESSLKAYKLKCLKSKAQQAYFTNSEEFKEYYRSNSTNSYCSEEELKAFDFKKYNVLLVTYIVQGCQPPDFKYKIYKTKDQYYLDFKIKLKGGCLSSNYIGKYFLLPKNESKQTPKIKLCYYGES